MSSTASSLMDLSAGLVPKSSGDMNDLSAGLVPNPQSPEAVAARHQRGIVQGANEPGTGNFATDVLHGAEKGAGSTAKGLTNLANTALPAGAQIPVSPNDTTTHGAGEKIGDVGENVLEFMGGEGLAKLASIGTKAPWLLDAIEKYPKASKIILGAVTGGVQGGVKGAATGEGVKGAEAGAAGGAGGATIGEFAAPAMKWLAKVSGLGGLSAEEALTKAGRPSVTDRANGQWSQNLQRALPYLKGANFKTVGEFGDAIHNAADRLWSSSIEPEIQAHANEMIDTNSVRDAVRKNVTKSLVQHFPQEAAAMEDFANSFQGTKTVADADEALHLFNAKLKSLYRMTAEGQHAAGMSDTNIANLESAATELRNKLYNYLDPVGQGKVPRQLRQDYGALKDMERVFDRRTTVQERQGGLNLAQLVSLIPALTGGAESLMHGNIPGAVASVLPEVAVTASKYRNAPESLIRQGLSAAFPGAVKQAASAAAPIAKEAVAGAGSYAGQQLPHPENGTIRVQLGDGSIQDVHQDDFAAYQQQHPDSHVIHQQ